MERSLVIETAYEIIKDAIEWGEDDKEAFINHVDGVCNMTYELLTKLEAKKEEKISPWKDSETCL